MISAVDLRAGMTFIQDGKLIKVLDASHHKPGKGNTIMRMKLRDVRTGSTFDTSYRPEEKFDQAIIPVIQNRHARVETNMTGIKEALTEQLSQPVLWSKTMQELADKQIGILIECGSGNVLSNLAKRQAHPITSYPTDKLARLDKLIEVLS